MIAYDLQCDEGHKFEGWFEDEKAYKAQQSKGMIACPICNRSTVTRIPSTFGIKSAGSGITEKAVINREVDVDHLTEEVARYVKDTFDDVGCEFAKEALKIHYGVAEPRNIRGKSTSEEEKVLKKEGVQFFKLPLPTSTDSPDTES
jgi:hypothetical protein